MQTLGMREWVGQGLCAVCVTGRELAGALWNVDGWLA